jgi:ribosomal-protein-alanine N-acetyltransferase|nr:GNAT family protein [Bacteroides intestinalis]
MDKIFLRGFQIEDHLLINKWRNDSEIQKLVSTSFKYVSLEIEKEWVKQKMMDNRKDIYLAICLNNASQQMIGYASLNNIDYINRTVMSGGIVIADKQYQDGFIRFEVGVKMRELVFSHLNMNRYTAACISEHFISRVTIEASGFKLEGCRRQAIYKDGSYHDQLCYSLLREEYYKMLEDGQYAVAAYAKRVKQISDRLKKEK